MSFNTKGENSIEMNNTQQLYDYNFHPENFNIINWKPIFSI